MRPGDGSSWWILTLKYRSRFSEPTYGFRDALEDDEVKSYMKQVVEDIKKEGSWDDSKIPRGSSTVLERKRPRRPTRPSPCPMVGKGAGVLTSPGGEHLENRRCPLLWGHFALLQTDLSGSARRTAMASMERSLRLNHEVALVKLRRGWLKGRKMKIEIVPAYVAYVEEVSKRYQ